MSIVLTVLLIIVIIQFILVFVIIFDQRRNPTSTVGWIMVLLLLPVLGFFLYLFFGQDWTSKRRLFSRKAEDDRHIADVVISKKKELERIGREHHGDLFERFLSITRMLLESNQAIISNDNALTIFTDG